LNPQLDDPKNLFALLAAPSAEMQQIKRLQTAAQD
jgi:hypothetical protein